MKESRSEKSTFLIEDKVIAKSDEHQTVDIYLPVIQGYKESKERNDFIALQTENKLQDFTQTAEEYKASLKLGATWELQERLFLWSTWETIEADSFVSVLLKWEQYTGGVHGNYSMEALTLDKETGQVYTFRQLFDSKEGIAFIDKELERGITANADYYSNSAMDTVRYFKGEYQYFMNGDNLIIFFNPYEIAPYSGGMQYFAFDIHTLKPYLKSKVYKSMEGAEEIDLDTILFEGIHLETP